MFCARSLPNAARSVRVDRAALLWAKRGMSSAPRQGEQPSTGCFGHLKATRRGSQPDAPSAGQETPGSRPCFFCLRNQLVRRGQRDVTPARRRTAEPRRTDQRVNAAAVEERKGGGTSRPRVRATKREKDAASSLQRPPTSMARTTRPQLLRLSEFLLRASVNERRATSAPTTPKAANIVSAASWAPPRGGQLLATKSNRPSSRRLTARWRSARRVWEVTLRFRFHSRPKRGALKDKKPGR